MMEDMSIAITLGPRSVSDSLMSKIAMKLADEGIAKESIDNFVMLARPAIGQFYTLAAQDGGSRRLAAARFRHVIAAATAVADALEQLEPGDIRLLDMTPFDGSLLGDGFGVVPDAAHVLARLSAKAETVVSELAGSKQDGARPARHLITVLLTAWQAAGIARPKRIREADDYDPAADGHPFLDVAFMAVESLPSGTPPTCDAIFNSLREALNFW